MSKNPLRNRRWRYVSRDSYSASLQVWSGKPHSKEYIVDGVRFTSMSYTSAHVCARGFELLFGINVEPGTCVKVEFGAAKVIK